MCLDVCTEEEVLLYLCLLFSTFSGWAGSAACLIAWLLFSFFEIFSNSYVD